jgi:hypothetical protein
MSPKEREELGVLNGDRGNKQEAALRLKHAQALLSTVPAEPTGDATADIRALYAGLNALRTLLR